MKTASNTTSEMSILTPNKLACRQTDHIGLTYSLDTKWFYQLLPPPGGIANGRVCWLRSFICSLTFVETDYLKNGWR